MNYLKMGYTQLYIYIFISILLNHYQKLNNNGIANNLFINLNISKCYKLNNIALNKYNIFHNIF